MPIVNGTWPITLATVPRQRAMSPKFSDAAATSTRTSPGPGSGTGMSWSSSASSGAACCTTRTARMWSPSPSTLGDRGAYESPLLMSSGVPRAPAPSSPETVRHRVDARGRALAGARWRREIASAAVPGTVRSAVVNLDVVYEIAVPKPRRAGKKATVDARSARDDPHRRHPGPRLSRVCCASTAGASSCSAPARASAARRRTRSPRSARGSPCVDQDPDLAADIAAEVDATPLSGQRVRPRRHGAHVRRRRTRRSAGSTASSTSSAWRATPTSPR